MKRAKTTDLQVLMDSTTAANIVQEIAAQHGSSRQYTHTH